MLSIGSMDKWLQNTGCLAMWNVDQWTALGSVLSGIGTVVGAVAVIVAAIYGSRTFDSWRAQNLASRRVEQAERILTAAYKARRALAAVRSPLMFAHELYAAEEFLKKQEPPLGSHLSNKLIEAQAYYNRLDKTLEDRRAVDECLPMARALFGQDVETALCTLNRQFHLVGIAAEAIVDLENDRDFEKSLRADLSSSGTTSAPNKMNGVIDEQIELIEDRCVPVLRLNV